MAKIYRELGDSERAGYYEEKYSQKKVVLKGKDINIKKV